MEGIDISALRQGDRRTLAKAITLVESRASEHQHQSHQLIANLSKEQRKSSQNPSLRLAISGSPGVGKSTFIESLGLLLTRLDLNVAILAIDPSSPLSGGSILGDKTRMERLLRERRAFIRPSPSLGALGGVTQSTRAAILLCEMAKFDVIIVETVGAGQSEVDVANITDIFTLLIEPGGGDGLQGIKKGILEVADLVIVNKADDERLALAENTRQEYEASLRLVDETSSRTVHKDSKRVLCCSALQELGLEEVWRFIDTKWRSFLTDDTLLNKRRLQEVSWLQRLIVEQLVWRLAEQPGYHDQMEALKSELKSGAITVEEAVETFYDDLLSKRVTS